MAEVIVLFLPWDMSSIVLAVKPHFSMPPEMDETTSAPDHALLHIAIEQGLCFFIGTPEPVGARKVFPSRTC